MATGNDSLMAIRVAIEPTYAAPPVYILTISGTPSVTFALNYRGVATAAIAVAATAGTIATAMATAWAAANPNATFAAAGTITSGVTITVSGGNAAAYEMTADFALTVAGVKTFTGGPVYISLRDTKFNMTPQLSIHVVPSMRNSRYDHFADAVVAGATKCDVEWDGPVYADQIGPTLVAAGATDTVSTTSTSVGNHSFKWGTSNGKSLCVQIYDGQVWHVSVGVVLTEVKFDTKGGPQALATFTAKGWGWLGDRATETITYTAPSDTTYKALAPTTTGSGMTIAAVAFNIIEHSTYTFDSTSAPFYTKTGTRNPRRPEYKQWGLKATSHTMLEDAMSDGNALTEIAKVYADAPVGYAVVETVADSYVIPSSSPSTVASIAFTTPANLYEKPKFSYAFGAAKVTLDGLGLYNAAAATAFTVLVLNDRLTSY